MADKENKWEQNVSGKYYVDDQCIACDACTIEAPAYFLMNEQDGHAFVYLQPTTDEGLEECENALMACPVEAIGRDGA